MDVKAFAEEHGLLDKDLILTVQSQFKRYDKYLHSKVKRPDECGIRLVAEAEKLLEEEFALKPPAPRRADKRRLQYRIQCRLTKRKLTRLQQCFRRHGYDTIQSGLNHIIDDYLEREEAGHE